jgi:pimeloyl-ACP methyl ester carboxylesterase
MLGRPMSEPHHTETVAPERASWVDSEGVRLRLHEWGDPEATPVLLCHGMFDHGRGFDMLAPRLAARFRVLSLDARGHGDSGWADAYIWAMDLIDIVRVLRGLGRPAHLVGHSKGGGQVTDAAVLAPECVRQVVNIDGFGPPDDEGFSRPGADALEDTSVAGRCAVYLDRRRGASARTDWRPYASLDDLVARRGAQNPRLDRAWLRYFVFHGAREHVDGWRWKSDPQMAAGGFGPWKPQWIAPGWRRLRAPLLAVVGSVPDAWGPLPEPLLSERLSHVPRVERATVEGAGHFVHMEHPIETADLLLSWLEP